MISRLLRFSFSTVRAEPWPVPCCLHVTGLLLLRARAGPPERHFLPRGLRPPGAPHYLSRHVLARTCWVMGRTTPLRLLPSSSRSDSGPLSPSYAARQHLESRFWHNQKPWPSYTSSLRAVRWRLRKTNTVPLKGSSPSAARHCCARPSIPRRKSTGSTATSIRICGVI